MKVIQKVPTEITDALNIYRDWVLQPEVSGSLQNKIKISLGKLFDQGRGEEATSLEYLSAIDPETHSGQPLDSYGFNLDYNVVRKNRSFIDPVLYDEVREINNKLDDKLETILGAKACALKMYYPAGGYIDWHTNWDLPGYNIIFTYSQSGKGHWRHIDGTGSRSLRPKLDNLVHIPDQPGWHCKMGYFGSRQELDKIVWHSAYTAEPRITISYLIFDYSLWKSVENELSR